MIENVIIGLGETGFSCVKYLATQGKPCIVLDSRENPPKLNELESEFSDVPVYLGEFSKDILQQAKTIIVSPGISKDLPVFAGLPKSIEIIGDVELFARHARAPIVGITGSNGKSTVTTLVGEMAKASGLNVGVGGNLGTPALTLLESNPSLYVLELSSFQLELTTSLPLTAATILNISPDHMDRYPTIDEYLAAKLRIFQHCEQIIANREDELILQQLSRENIKFTFGNDLGNENGYGIYHQQLAKGKTPLLPIKELKLFGRHNVVNALAALALGEACNLSMPAMLSVLRSFRGLEHRCEWVRTIQQIPWINDSKGTNVGATKVALEGLKQDIAGKWVLIAGGLGKNADFSPLVPVIQQHCRAVVLLGEAKDELYQLLQNKVNAVKVLSMEEAVTKAKALALPGDGILLSPACASFDMFQNFEERGKVFKALVQAL